MSAVPEGLARLRSAANASTFDPVEAMKRARDLLGPSMQGRTMRDYPAHALGPLASACEAIAEAGQLQPAMAGQTLLAAASLLTQGLYNVETLNGVRPLSINGATLADSGDGKSTAQDAALRTITQWQRDEAKRYGADVAAYDKAKATRKKNDDPPEEPESPFRIVADATVEGLRRDFANGPCSQGVFSDEAASILCGYGMSADHRSKTAATFSKMWDSGHISVSRAGGARLERYGRRLAVSWLIQPQAASESVGDPMLSALGFWPRFLAAWPEPQAPRLARPFRPDALPAVAAYWAQCSELLGRDLPEDAWNSPTISLDEPARDLLGKAFERFEVAARQGAMRPIKPFALRASEQACRVAGVLTAFNHADRIDRDTMRSALEVVTYSLDTWLSLIDGSAADQGGADALRLYEWLLKRPGWRETLAKIVNSGPTRSKDKRDAAIERLADVGLIEVHERTAFALMPGSGDD